jgi:hypothetical protein
MRFPHQLVGRVAPCAPGQFASDDGAHGVTRPTSLGHFVMCSYRSEPSLRFEPREPSDLLAE